jgi:dTDP-4-dehydrorhamnose 3,5-epimerase
MTSIDRANARVTLDVAVEPVADVPTVTRDGLRLAPTIDGVTVRSATVHSDDRGALTEIFNPAWDPDGDPLVYIYQATVRPGKVKGWVVHFEQEDRLFFDDGAAKIVLYDARVGSPTKGMINELYLGTANRGLVRIPPGVFHAVANVGEHELRFVNLPTQPYRHDRPDKARLPEGSEAIPYRF